ncbi:MAG: putative Sec-independent protein translocase protein TatB [Actinomycetota bacterium]
MFNLSGSEIVVILLLALIVLGPEKLPEAIRRFGRVYGELKRMSRGFQTDIKSAFEDPVRELKETAQLTKEAVTKAFDGEAVPPEKPRTSSEAVDSAEPREPSP